MEDQADKDKLLYLFSEYGAAMFHAAKSILHNEKDAEDAEYAAWENIIRNVKNVDMSRNPEGYVITAARNEAFRILKRSQREFDEEPEIIETREHPSPPVADQAEDRDSVQIVVFCIEALPDLYSGIMKMKYISGLSIKQIAKLLHLNENTVKTRLSTGRKLLADKLRERGYSICLPKK